MFWFLSAILLFLASLFILLPLWQYYRSDVVRNEQLRSQVNLRIFSERRDELERELAAGNLSQQEFDALLLELQKSLLIDIAGESLGPESSLNNQARSAVTVPNKLGAMVPLLLLIVMLSLVYPLYGLWGSLRDVAARSLYEQTFANVMNDAETARNLILALGEVVQKDPDNGWAWYFLARNFSVIGQFNEAAIGFERAIAGMDDGPDKAAVLGQYAQIKYIMASGKLTGEVTQIVNQARLINPNEWSVLQLLSIDAEMNEDYATAISYWRLMIQANPNSAEAQILRNSIATAQARLAEQRGDGPAAGPRIEVLLTVSEALDLNPDLRVFVSARNASQPGLPPLAATDLLVGDLPAIISLDNSSAMVPQFNISSADTIYITAAVSQTGSANIQSGDYRAVSENFAHNGQHTVIELTITDRVP